MLTLSGKDKHYDTRMFRRQWIRLKRFGHRRGYGVHSPFAFGFLTDVVYERGEYYAYRELRKRYPAGCPCGGLHRLKCRKFLFRLSNYVHPSQIRIYGHVKEAETAYLAAGCRSAAVCRDLFWGERAREDGGFARQKELTVVGRGIEPRHWTTVVSRPPTRSSVCLLFGIRASKAASRAWDDVKRLPETAVTFDLYDYGVVFYDRSKQRQDYIVYF